MIVQRLQSISAFFLDDEAKQSQTLKANSSAEPDTGCPKKMSIRKNIARIANAVPVTLYSKLTRRCTTVRNSDDKDIPLRWAHTQICNNNSSII